MYDFVERFLARVWLGSTALLPTAHEARRVASAVKQDSATPMSFQELDASSGALVNRIGLQWEGNVYRLLIRGDSIDFEYRTPKEGTPLTFAEYLGEAKIMLGALAEQMERSASRIAAVQEVILPEMPPDALDRIGRKLLRVSSTFEQSALFEWDWRAFAKVNRAIGNTQEATNTIGHVKRLTGYLNNESPIDRLRISTDINTAPENTHPRLSHQNVREFLEQSVTWHQDLITELANFMGIET